MRIGVLKEGGKKLETIDETGSFTRGPADGNAPAVDTLFCEPDVPPVDDCEVLTEKATDLSALRRKCVEQEEKRQKEAKAKKRAARKAARKEGRSE